MIRIEPFYYNVVSSSEFGNTYNIIGNQRLAYRVEILKNYWECENEIDAKNQLIYDLTEIKKELQQELEQRRARRK